MKLRDYRRQTEITLAALAKKVGVSEVAMSRYERGERMPRPVIMRDIERVTDGKVRPNDFVSGAQDEGATAEQDADAPRTSEAASAEETSEADETAETHSGRRKGCKAA